jgi:molybdenum storage protein
MPPYHFWEPPPREGRLPENGSDLGAFMTAEVLGVNQMVFIKDRQGQFTRNPAKHSDATLMKECRVADLIGLPADDLIVERSVLEALNRARHVKSIQIINGLERGTLKRALDGENAGTIIMRDEA